MTIIKDGAQLDAAIKEVGTARQKLDDQVQTLALSALWHFGVRTGADDKLVGDVGYINRLYANLGKGARHVAFTDWVTKFGGVQANTGAGKAQTPFVKDKGKVVDMEGAENTKWYNCKPSKAPDEVIDLYSLLLKVCDKAEKPGATIIGAEAAAEVRKLVEAKMQEAIDKAAAMPAMEDAPL